MAMVIESLADKDDEDIVRVFEVLCYKEREQQTFKYTIKCVGGAIWQVR